jgi:ribosomal protein S18 acetylase RimI-like enzyme
MALVTTPGNAFGSAAPPSVVAATQRAARALELLAGEGEGRAAREFGSATGVDLGVPQPWGRRVGCWTGATTRDEVDAALEWIRDRAAGRGFRLAAWTARGPWDHAGLVVRDLLPALAMPAADAARLDRPVPAELELGAPRDREELVQGYGGWMADDPLARLLVTEDDLARPWRGYVVGRVDGRVVGCALVAWAEGTAYVSGLGVVADLRGHGYGGALTVAAARLGALGPPAGPAPELVWLLGTPEGAAVYARLGFRPAGEEVQLGPVDGP